LPLLDLSADCGQNGLDVEAQRGNRGDADGGDKAQDEAVFGETLAGVIGKNGLNVVKHGKKLLKVVSEC